METRADSSDRSKMRNKILSRLKNFQKLKTTEDILSKSGRLKVAD